MPGPLEPPAHSVCISSTNTEYLIQVIFHSIKDATLQIKNQSFPFVPNVTFVENQNK